ncbi:DUF2778 domain-containing protein [Rhodobacterales bacterium]|nr:DUF2778 domain-containing protein [Rhodobacterales bacterium]
MLQKKRHSARKDNRTHQKSERRSHFLLAGVTLLICGGAVAATLLSPASAPGQLPSTAPVAQSLSIVQAEPNRTASAEQQADATLSDASAKAADEKDTRRQSLMALAAAREAADRAEAERKAAELKAAAHRHARKALAEKLARLNLTTTLLAAQATSRASEEEARLAALELAPSAKPQHEDIVVQETVVAGIASSEEGEQVVEELEETAVAVLETEVPVKPGAILPPSLKPEPPRRSAPAVASKPKSEEPENSGSTVLAYANPGNPEEENNGVFSGIGKLFGGGSNARAGDGVAVYDISAATVHMPDGTKLEAHSGIGHRMDNPKYAHVKNYGPTPPNVYKLRMRERRFHGVEAIRMLPYDKGAMKGRDGMLTHTRLLRSSIGSHGCVAFKDYNKFLTAFKRGKIHTLIVVPAMNKLPRYVAMMERRGNAS